MSKIASAFDHGKAFIPFITCGDPQLKVTEDILKAMADNGADLIELGIPFSDPTAEGPVIQGANIRALQNSVTTDDVFEMVARVRSTIKVPLVFMTYANVVFSYGIEKFAQAQKDTDMDGLILPDVPFEEKNEFAPAFRERGLDFISLIAPTSDQRVGMIAKEAEGFVYCVSSMGVTGMRDSLSTSGEHLAEEVKKYTDVPAAIGFGIHSPEQARENAQHADGVIVGSAIVNLVAEHGADAVPYVADYVKSMKDAISNI